MPVMRSATVAQATGIHARLFMLLMASLALNAYFVAEHLRVAPSHSADEATGRALRLGSRAPIFEVANAEGRVSGVLNYADDPRETLLYICAPGSRLCARNLANIRTLVRLRSDLRIIGVSLGASNEDADFRSIGFDSIVHPSAATIATYDLSATPITILVSRRGTILKTWAGPYTGKLGLDLSKFLAVDLPGLSD